MPGPKRERRERTDEWTQIKQWTLWPKPELYEQIRPLVLYHETAGERAKEIDVPQRTLSRKADEFERSGMASLFPSGEAGGARAPGKTLPEEVRQAIRALHAEMPTMSWREIAEMRLHSLWAASRSQECQTYRHQCGSPNGPTEAIPILAPDDRPSRAQISRDSAPQRRLVSHQYC